jgi:very-short-patch-repair endonuclease
MEARRETVARARELRSKTSLPEGVLWQILRSRQFEGLKFRRQHPMGPYIVDFFCSAARLVVEVDGQGHGMPEQQRHDSVRDAWLAGQGVQVVRLPARLVLSDQNVALDMIRNAIGAKRPTKT